MKNANKKRFTLIDLLVVVFVVVLIIGILVLCALQPHGSPRINLEKSRYSMLMLSVNVLAEAEELYYVQNDSYTDNFEDLDLSLEGCTLSSNKKTCSYTWGSCTLKTEHGDRVECVNNTTLKNAYAKYLKYGKYASWDSVCYSLSTDKNDKYGKLCESVGATYYDVTSCPPHGDCLIYRF